MRVAVLSTGALAARNAARCLARALEAHPDLVLGLPTGRTMIPVYDALVKQHRRGRADFRRATTFNLDEFAGLPRAHSGSYRAFMRRHLLDAVNLRIESAHFPSEDVGGPAYDRAIALAGGLDLCLLGIGTNGHIGFNEPGPKLIAGTHRVRLTTGTRRANAYLFSQHMSGVPRMAMSMGIGTILNARTIVLIATGADKAAIVRRALDGPVTTRVPASFIQTHPGALVILDRAAARLLRSR